ncbi:MAG: hypothetical protein ACRCZK_06925 [Oscillospiraceae bacterium]
MKNILSSLKFEIKHGFLSKQIIIVFSIITLISIGFAFLVNSQISSNINDFNKLYNDVKQNLNLNDKEIQQYIYEDVTSNSTLNDDGSILSSIDTPLASYRERVEESIYVASPDYFTQNILNNSIYIIFPIIMCVFASMVLARDYETSTIKIMSINKSWGKNYLGKILYIYIVSTILIVYTLIIGHIASLIIENKTIKNIGSSIFKPYSKTVTFNIVLNAIIALLITLTFVSMISMLVVTLTKKFIPIIAGLVYILGVPVLGKFDLKSIMLNISNEYYPQTSPIGTIVVEELNITLCFIILIAIIVICNVISIFVSEKQSKYI